MIERAWVILILILTVTATATETVTLIASVSGTATLKTSFGSNKSLESSSILSVSAMGCASGFENVACANESETRSSSRLQT